MTSSRTPLPLLELLPEGRRRLLELLKGGTPLGAEEAARAMGMTVSGARQQLAALEGSGLISRTPLREGPGRPRHLFTLTPAGDALFPRRYAEFSQELLSYLSAQAPDLLSDFFRERTRRRVAAAQLRLLDPSLEGRVRELARILDEEGYRSELELLDGGGFLLLERNCAIRTIAQGYPLPCQSEIDFIRELLPDASVRRISHQLHGGRACAYEILPLEAPVPTT